MVLTVLKRVLTSRGEATLSELVAETQLDTETVTVGLDYWRRRGDILVQRVPAGRAGSSADRGLPLECETRPCGGCALSGVCSTETGAAVASEIVVYCWKDSRSDRTGKQSRQTGPNDI